jgi:rod shape determining protein RodA
MPIYLYRPNILRRLGQQLRQFDEITMMLVGLILVFSLLVLYSAGLDFRGRFIDHWGNLMLAFVMMWVVSLVPMQTWVRVAIPIYVAVLLLLVAVALFGTIKNGARRWLSLGGFAMQPSELMKLALPLMLAAIFQKYEDVLAARHYFFAFILLLIPVLLIARQPDLGTAILVFTAGFYVIFFAGLSWRVLLGSLVFLAISLPFLWNSMHAYQRRRIFTFLNSENDPLGSGFHIIQSIVAIGSGGIIGKGWLQGTQTHLEFLPERTTDFIFATFSEEFGFIGAFLLLLLYFLLILRIIFVASQAATLFARLFCVTVGMQFFTYVFVNIGMVTGMLPVVGVPLPLMSYGGTAMLATAVSLGILMGVHRSRYLVQT